MQAEQIYVSGEHRSQAPLSLSPRPWEYLMQGGARRGLHSTSSRAFTTYRGAYISAVAAGPRGSQGQVDGDRVLFSIMRSLGLQQQGLAAMVPRIERAECT